MALSCLHHASCRMSRDQRVQDNWAFLHAAEVASKTKSPVAVVFNLVGLIYVWHTRTMHACDHLYALLAYGSTNRLQHLIGYCANLLPLYMLMCHVVALTEFILAGPVHFSFVLFGCPFAGSPHFSLVIWRVLACLMPGARPVRCLFWSSWRQAGGCLSCEMSDAMGRSQRSHLCHCRCQSIWWQGRGSSASCCGA